VIDTIKITTGKDNLKNLSMGSKIIYNDNTHAIVKMPIGLGSSEVVFIAETKVNSFFMYLVLEAVPDTNKGLNLVNGIWKVDYLKMISG
jgi:hypothetical protein